MLDKLQFYNDEEDFFKFKIIVKKVGVIWVPTPHTYQQLVTSINLNILIIFVHPLWLKKFWFKPAN